MGKGSRYNPIPPEKIFERLERAGFTRTRVGGEVAYERKNHHRHDLRVRVLTSASVKGDIRGCGEDAIRVYLIWTYKDLAKDKLVDRCVKKGKRIHRTGTDDAILDRIMERARELYGLANEIAKQKGPCRHCGALRYPRGGCVLYCQRR